MKNCDLLITWHESCDYPLARATLKKYRNFWGKIIIYFSKHFREPVYTDFLKKSMLDLGNIVFLDPIEYEYGSQDWRNISTNYMLGQSTSEWVCSVEQDWFSKDWPKLLEVTEKGMKEHDLFGYWTEAGAGGGYIHPAYWFIKRELLNKTSLDFAAHQGEDHFGWITRDVERLGGNIGKVQDYGLSCDVAETADAYHLGGVNNNYLEGLKPNYVFHRPEPFLIYNYECRQADVPQDSRFLGLSQDIEKVLLDKIGPINLKDNQWTKFFKV